MRRLGERGITLAGGSTLTLAYMLWAFSRRWCFFRWPCCSQAWALLWRIARCKRATELVPSMRGTAVALFAFSLFIGGGLGTWLAGLAIDRLGYGSALAATALLLALFTAVAGPALAVGRRRV